MRQEDGGDSSMLLEEILEAPHVARRIDSRLASRRGTKYECALYEARASAPYIVGEHHPSCLRSDLIARCGISATSRVEPDFDSTRRRSPVSSSHSLSPRS